MNSLTAVMVKYGTSIVPCKPMPRWYRPASSPCEPQMSYAPIMKNLLFIVLCLATCVQAADLRGRVVAVSDGDTVTVLDAERHQHKVRLAGIDAPEKAQAFGQASKISLSDQIFGREVAVSWDKRDRYGRIIGKISVDHRDVCLEQIRRGMAWHYKQYARDQAPDDRGAYAEAEVAARAARAGLWHDLAPVPPWEWRHKK